ncbi:MAG: hypothetical protein COT09_03630 [Candidatus Hydromicrobium americanum]|nr:MAG: hypothetical protein COT09_03630 [Candidatus Hydromicrobium americanum]
MNIKIILNGGLKSCCSTYPPEYVREVVKGWLKETDEVEVIDKQQGNWSPDDLVSVAEKYFGDSIYPLLYSEDTLVAIGNLPDRDTLVTMATNKAKFGITEENIRKEAKRQGLLKEE